MFKLLPQARSGRPQLEPGPRASAAVLLPGAAGFRRGKSLPLAAGPGPLAADRAMPGLATTLLMPAASRYGPSRTASRTAFPRPGPGPAAVAAYQ